MVSLSRLELIANTQELSSSMEVSICLNILITGIFKGAKFLKPKGILNVHEVNRASRAFLCKEMEEKPQLNIAQQGFSDVLVSIPFLLCCSIKSCVRNRFRLGQLLGVSDCQILFSFFFPKSEFI